MRLVSDRNVIVVVKIFLWNISITVLITWTLPFSFMQIKKIIQGFIVKVMRILFLMTSARIT